MRVVVMFNVILLRLLALRDLLALGTLITTHARLTLEQSTLLLFFYKRTRTLTLLLLNDITRDHANYYAHDRACSHACVISTQSTCSSTSYETRRQTR